MTDVRWKTAHTVLTVLQALSLTALVATTMYPHEWGALTNTGNDILAKLNVPEGHKSAGFNERFNLVFKYDDKADTTIHRGNHDSEVTYVYEVKCSKYLAAKGNFKSHCRMLKVERLIFAAAIAMVVFFKVAELMNVGSIATVACGPELLSGLGTLIAVIIMAVAARMCHIFVADADSIGSLNAHGHAYFGLIVTFSVTLVLASIGIMVVDSKTARYELTSTEEPGANETAQTTFL